MCHKEMSTVLHSASTVRFNNIIRTFSNTYVSATIMIFVASDCQPFYLLPTYAVTFCDTLEF